MTQQPLRSTLFPYTTLFRSVRQEGPPEVQRRDQRRLRPVHPRRVQEGPVRAVQGQSQLLEGQAGPRRGDHPEVQRSEEHTSELQSRLHLVCRLLLEKKKKST